MDADAATYMFLTDLADANIGTGKFVSFADLQRRFHEWCNRPENRLRVERTVANENAERFHVKVATDLLTPDELSVISAIRDLWLVSE